MLAAVSMNTLTATITEKKKKTSIDVSTAVSSVTSNPWGSLDDNTRRRLHRLTLRDGYFRYYLNYYKDKNRFHVFTAWAGDEPIACLWLEWTKPGQTALCGVYVKKKYRRNGIGTLLLDHATAQFPKIRFRTYHWNSSSRAFFLQNKKQRDHDIVCIKTE